MLRAAVLFAAIVQTTPASASAPITNGGPASDAAVVALVRGGALACTGTIIAAHAVLTAAHCVAQQQLPDVVAGDTIAGATDRRTPIAVLVDPDFDAQTLAHDVAVLIFDAPFATPPMPIATGLGGVTIGGTVRVVGYGWTIAGDPAPPQRRTGTSRITAIDPAELASIGAPSQTCEGDSGGPALADDGSGERVVGIASSGDPACSQHARHARVDAHAAFIAGVVTATAAHAAAAGARCWYQDNCAVGACTPALDEPRLAFCAPSCADAACPDGLDCVEMSCRPPTPSPGANGAPCTSGGECVDAACLAPRGSTLTVCTRSCISDLPGFGCPAGATCQLATDGSEACFLTPRDSGCRAGGDGRGLWLVVLALFGHVLRGRGKP